MKTIPLVLSTLALAALLGVANESLASSLEYNFVVKNNSGQTLQVYPMPSYSGFFSAGFCEQSNGWKFEKNVPPWKEIGFISNSTSICDNSSIPVEIASTSNPNDIVTVNHVTQPSEIFCTVNNTKLSCGLS